MIEYWNLRAPGYSLATRLSLNSDHQILESLNRVVNLGKRMRVVDMGTGAGEMAIRLAGMGHDVTGVDFSERMIDLARKNAKDLGLSIDFRVMDVQSPDLSKLTYDLVVAKNVVWCLEDPVEAFKNWIEMVKPGGYIVVIDGNWYLDLFDEDYRRRKHYLDMRDGSDNNFHVKTNIGGVDLNIMKGIARELPLSHERRPTWDVSALLGLGMADIHIRSLDSFPYSVLTENGFMKLPNKFIVSAQKPYDVDSSSEAFCKPIDDSKLCALSRVVKATGVRELPTLKAMADIRRLEIVIALMNGRMSVSQISTTIGASPSLVSHNLRILKNVGIVESSKEGKEVKYSLTNAYVIKTMLDMCCLLGKSSESEKKPVF